MGYDKHKLFIDELLEFLWKKRMSYWEDYERRLKEHIQSQEHPRETQKQKPSISVYDQKANTFLRLFLFIRDTLYVKDDPRYLKTPYPLPPFTDELKRSFSEIKAIFAKHKEEVPAGLIKIE